MARFVCRKFAKLNFEPLEDRTTPAVSVSLVGNVVTFTGDGANDPLGINVSGNGFLAHTLQVGGVGMPQTSEDLDPNTAGVQRRTPASLTSLVVNLGGGTDNISIIDVAIPTTLANTENVQIGLSGATNATLTNSNVAITFPVLGTFNYGISGQSLIIMDGGQGVNSGVNIFDASAVTNYNTYMRGYDGNDILRGGALPDRLEGGEGNDTLEGNGGDDNNAFYPTIGTSGGLYGGNGNDILRGGAGDDYLEDTGPMGAADGGTGNDFYRAFSASGAQITDTTFSMGGAVSIGNAIEAFFIDGDDNANILDASGVTKASVWFRGFGGNDTLIGTELPDRLEGGDNDDMIEGRGGDDSQTYLPSIGTSGGLYGGNGNDTLRGGNGNDYIEDIGPIGSADGGAGTGDYYFMYSAAGAVVTNTTLSVGGAPSIGMGFEGIRIDGDDNANVLDASALTTTGVWFRGNGGNDTISGSQMPDRLEGKDGDDTISGNDGNEDGTYIPSFQSGSGIYGGNGNDTLRGGNGNDYIEDIGPDGAADGGAGTGDYYFMYSAAAAVVTNTSLSVGGAASIGMTFEGIRIEGDDNANVLDASGLTTTGVWFRGFSGNDTISGSQLPDRLEGNDGDDTISGNDGNDDGTYIPSFQSSSGIYGGNGNDTLRGGNGNDYIEDIGPMGAADGGAGTGDYYYMYSAAGAVVTNTTLSIGGAASIGMTFEGIRIDGDDNANVLDASALTTTGVWFRGNGGNDTISGSQMADRLEGMDGDDTISGNDGNEDGTYIPSFQSSSGLYGGNGNDTLRGGNGNDYIEDIGPMGAADGGAGTGDYYYMYSAAGAVVTNTTLSIGGAASIGMTFEGIRIDGDDNANVLDASALTTTGVWFRGNGGNDTISGSQMADRLEGMDGDDTISGNDGNEDGTYIPSFQSSSGLYGGNGNDTLRGGNGNDYIEDIGPDGAAEGGAGTDYLYIYDVASAVITDSSLKTGTATSVGNGFEGVRIDGTPGNDTFNATGFTLGSVWFRGNDGNDVLRGGEQPDRLEGGTGDDMLFGNGGDDTIAFIPNIGTNGGLLGSDGNDTLDGGAGNDTLDGGNNNDILTGGASNDLIYGGDGDDILRDGPETNTLVGDAGTDSIRLTATSGDDLILIADGSVTLNGAVTAYTLSESLIIDAGAGVDEGTQVGATHPLAYVVNNLEPTVFGGPDVTTIAVSFIRTGTFKDIGAGQNTWSGQADYGEGAGFEPIAVDSINKSFSLNHSYSAGGSFLVRIRITDQQGNTGESSFTVFRPAGVQVGVGGVQRSMIPKLTVSFDGLYTINPGYFTFQRLFNGTSPSVNAVISTLNNKTVITMTFSGAIEGNTNSLLDGDYRLTLDSTKILANPGGQQFDGNGDGSPGGAFVFNFHRLLGDGNGDRTVNGADLLQFGNVFSSNAPEFDFNIDGTVNGADFLVFGNHFGTTI